MMISVGDVWDQMIKNEECYARLVSVDDLNRMNQRVDELIAKRSTRPTGITPLIEPRTTAVFLRLLYDRLIFKHETDGRGVVQLKLTQEQMEQFLKEAVVPWNDTKKQMIEEIKNKASQDALKEAEYRFREDISDLERENQELKQSFNDFKHAVRQKGGIFSYRDKENERLSSLVEALPGLEKKCQKLSLENKTLREQNKGLTQINNNLMEESTKERKQRQKEIEEVAQSNMRLNRELAATLQENSELRNSTIISMKTLRRESEVKNREISISNHHLDDEVKKLKQEIGNRKQERDDIKRRAGEIIKRLRQRNSVLNKEYKRLRTYSDFSKVSSGNDPRNILEQLAAIIGLTYGELGDSALLNDEKALARIRDLLLDYDDQIVEQSYYNEKFNEILKPRN